MKKAGRVVYYDASTKANEYWRERFMPTGDRTWYRRMVIENMKRVRATTGTLSEAVHELLEVNRETNEVPEFDLWNLRGDLEHLIQTTLQIVRTLRGE